MAELHRRRPPRALVRQPKGPRHGELHRHAALQEARGEIVCYLCDDDLWLPDHVERMRALLEEHDFAYTWPFWIDPEGEIHCYRSTCACRTSASSSSAARTGSRSRAARTRSTSTGGCRPAGARRRRARSPTSTCGSRSSRSPAAASSGGAAPTVLHFPSPERIGWSSEERLDELDRWAARLEEPGFRGRADRARARRHERRCRSPRSRDRTRAGRGVRPRRSASPRRRPSSSAWQAGRPSSRTTFVRLSRRRSPGACAARLLASRACGGRSEGLRGL